jgi:hypothetical protein
MRFTELLALPVRLHGIELGTVTEALVDREDDRVVGFEIHCGDDAQRFVPFAVVEVRPGEIALGSALTLIDERDIGFYRTRSRRVADLDYADPWVDEHGVIHEAHSAA